MPNTMDGIFGIHTTALQARSTRTKLLASNLANADTPNYKSKDIDFASVIKKAANSGLTATRTHTTHKNHIPVSRSEFEGGVKYRTPTQSSLDGNTVESDIEQSLFAKNAIQYQASLNFISGKSKKLLSAIKGE